MREKRGASVETDCPSVLEACIEMFYLRLGGCHVQVFAVLPDMAVVGCEASVWALDEEGVGEHGFAYELEGFMDVVVAGAEVHTGCHHVDILLPDNQFTVRIEVRMAAADIEGIRAYFGNVTTYLAGTHIRVDDKGPSQPAAFLVKQFGERPGGVERPAIQRSSPVRRKV